MCNQLLLVTVLLAADADSLVQNITHKEPEFDSLAESLNIIQKSGTVDLSGEAPPVKIEVQLYKKGKKLATRLESVGVAAGSSKNNKHRIRFAVNFMDTDFLTLGDGKQGHCRLLMKLRSGAATSTTTLDVPKQECDFSKMTSGGAFRPKSRHQGPNPLILDDRRSNRLAHRRKHARSGHQKQSEGQRGDCLYSPN